MKKVFTILSFIFLVGCSSSEIVENIPQFDWMPNDLLWQHNVRDCRSQPQCNAGDLFERT